METEKMLKAIEELEETIHGLEAEAAIRKYCGEHGLDAKKASDYSRAACAVLEYELPGGAPARRKKGNNLPDKLRYSNERLRERLDCGKSSEYAVNIASKNNTYGCAACEKLADEGEHADTRGSDYGWWKDIERAVKSDRKEIGAKINEELGKVANEWPIKVFANQLRMIDYAYKSGMRAAKVDGKLIDEGTERIPESVKEINGTAVRDTKNLLRTSRFLADLFIDIPGDYERQLNEILSRTDYKMMRAMIGGMIHSYILALKSTGKANGKEKTEFEKKRDKETADRINGLFNFLFR
jgi:hypothetical protein